MDDEFTAHHESPPAKELLTATSLKRLDVRSAHFQKQLSDLAELDEITAEHGEANIGLDAANRVRIELKAAAPSYGLLPLAHFCAQHVFEWHNDKNPQHIDLALMVCAYHGIEPTPTLIKLATDVARARISKKPGMTNADTFKEHTKRQVFNLMMNLIYHGATLDEAGTRAAQWWGEAWPDRATSKVSTLTKQYTALFRQRLERQTSNLMMDRIMSLISNDETLKDAEEKAALTKQYSELFKQAAANGKTIEEEHFDVWNEFLPESTRDFWREVRTTLPFAEDDLIGTRR